MDDTVVKFMVVICVPGANRERELCGNINMKGNNGGVEFRFLFDKSHQLCSCVYASARATAIEAEVRLLN